MSHPRPHAPVGQTRQQRLSQYSGECSVINDPRPKVWQARGMSEEDDPRKVAAI